MTRSVCGGAVGSENDPMLDARQRLQKRLEKEGKKLEDVVGEGKGNKDQEPKDPPIKVQ